MSTFTPNLNLILQPRDNPDWDVGENANYTILDGLGGSATAGDILTSNGPGTPATFQPPAVPAGLGTVTSVALSVPSELAVAGSPITTSGTLAISKAVQNANKVWAGPTTGGDAQPTFRALVAADIPFTLPDFTTSPSWWGSFEGGLYGFNTQLAGQYGTGTANQVKCSMVRLPNAILVSKISTLVNTVGAGALAGFGYYTKTGTKLFSWDSIDVSTGGIKQTTLGSAVTLPPGIYFAAAALSNTASALSQCGYEGGHSSEGIETWNVFGTVRAGTCANVMSGGVMPATLGVISAGGGGFNVLPHFFMEP